MHIYIYLWRIQVGRLNEEWGDVSEMEFAARVGSMFCAAQIRTSPGESQALSGHLKVTVGRHKFNKDCPGESQALCREFAARAGSMFCAAQIRTSPGYEPQLASPRRGRPLPRPAFPQEGDRDNLD